MRLYLQKSLQEVFLMLIFVALPDWMFFILRLFSMPPALHLGISGLLRPSSALGSTVVTFGFLLFTGFSVTSLSRFIASAKVLSGLSFISRHFYLALLPHILAYLRLRREQEHPIQNLLLCLLL